MEYPNPNMLLYIAMGDAYAAAVEYINLPYIKLPQHAPLQKACLKFDRYHQHPTHKDIRPGMYTDDTEMSVANTHVLIECSPPYAPIMFARAYVREFMHGGKRKGYSRNFQKFLEEISSGEEFLARINPTSNKNGAAMRSVPFGVMPDIDLMLETAELQARITHDTPEGRFSSKLVALMSHFALWERAPFAQLPAYCMAHLSSDNDVLYQDLFHRRWNGEAVTAREDQSVAITTVHAVLDLLVHQTDLMSILRQIILWGGDTDSVAAIAWGIASARYQPESLPLFLEHDLEQGSVKTGAPYLKDLGQKLMAKFA